MAFTTVVSKNHLTSTILLFVILFGGIQYYKPNFLYEPNGAIRKFGVGWKKKTIMPVWVLAILLAVFSYLGVLYLSHLDA